MFLEQHLKLVRRLRAFATAVRPPLLRSLALPTRIPRLELSPFLLDFAIAASERRPEAERLAAAQRLAAQFERPVHATRWAAVRAAIQADALAAGRSFQNELQLRCVAAVFHVLPELDEFGLDELVDGLQSGLNTTVTEDALGPGWRRVYLTKEQRKTCRPEEVALDEAADVAGATDPAAQLAARQLLEAARLSDREAQLVAALLSGQTASDFARADGVSDSTARTLKERARRKISESL